MIARSAFVSLGLLGLFASSVSAQVPSRAAGDGPRLADVRRLIEAGVRSTVLPPRWSRLS